jgi:ferredoxin
MVFTIYVGDRGDSVRCRAGQSVLSALESAGRREVVVGCRGGGCGVCRVRIIEGQWALLKPMSRAHVSEAEEREGWVLACRVAPASDIRVQLPEK